MPQPANKRFVMEDKFTTELAFKAPIASPTFTGTITAGAGGISVPSGNVVLTTGNVTANTVLGNSLESLGPVIASTGISTTTGNVDATNGSVKAGSATPITNTSTGHALQAGYDLNPHVRIGQDATNAAIQAVSAGSYSELDVNTLGGNVKIGSATANITSAGSLIAATGDGTLSPLKIPAGTLMATPAEDVIEADANAFYGTTNVTHGRSVIATNLFSSGTATFTSTTAAQNVFPVPNDTLAMAANTTYMVEGLIHISVPAASSAAHTMSFTLNGGGAVTTGQVMAFATQNNTSATAIPTAAASYLLTGTGASTIWATASTVATAVFRTVHFKGIVRCTTAGTFIPRITTSVASVAIPAGRSDNYITLTPIGSNSVTSIGAWS